MLLCKVAKVKVTTAWDCMAYFILYLLIRFYPANLVNRLIYSTSITTNFLCVAHLPPKSCLVDFYPYKYTQNREGDFSGRTLVLVPWIEIYVIDVFFPEFLTDRTQNLKLDTKRTDSLTWDSIQFLYCLCFKFL